MVTQGHAKRSKPSSISPAWQRRLAILWNDTKRRSIAIMFSDTWTSTFSQRRHIETNMTLIEWNGTDQLRVRLDKAHQIDLWEGYLRSQIHLFCAGPREEWTLQWCPFQETFVAYTPSNCDVQDKRIQLTMLDAHTDWLALFDLMTDMFTHASIRTLIISYVGSLSTIRSTVLAGSSFSYSTPEWWNALDTKLLTWPTA